MNSLDRIAIYVFLFTICMYLYDIASILRG